MLQYIKAFDLCGSYRIHHSLKKHVYLTNGAGGLMFSLNLNPLPYFVCMSRESSGKTVDAHLCLCCYVPALSSTSILCF